MIYDCKHAKSIAEEICEYIQEHTEADSVCAHMDDIGKIEKTGISTKTIYIGHHSKIDKILEQMTSAQFCQYGMKYALGDTECVLTASKSKLEKSKTDKSQFVVEYCKRFDENPLNMYIRAAQFKYVAMEFIQNDLMTFVKED